MNPRINQLGQPIGDALDNWVAPPHPPRVALHGQYCSLEPLDPARHAESLFAANTESRNWTYLFSGPFPTLADYRAWMERECLGSDPQFYAVVDTKLGRATGVAAYLRITPAMGVIEVGHINFSPLLQRTRAATEAMYLMMRNAFELGYRRYEWKCDALNAPSRAAAQRLGLSYEGIFRQAIVVKGRNRDTAWFAAIDREWPELKAAFERWLDPANFDADGRQRAKLSDWTGPVLKAQG
ncbi:MAG: GNAT family protein [Bryobacteraceae bacterium]